MSSFSVIQNKTKRRRLTWPRPRVVRTYWPCCLLSKHLGTKRCSPNTHSLAPGPPRRGCPPIRRCGANLLPLEMQRKPCPTPFLCFCFYIREKLLMIQRLVGRQKSRLPSTQSALKILYRRLLPPKYKYSLYLLYDTLKTSIQWRGRKYNSEHICLFIPESVKGRILDND